MGLDTELIEGDVARSQVAVLVDVASKQGRVCLTRDHKLAEQRGSGAVYLLASDDAKEQFNDIQKRFGIRCSFPRFILLSSELCTILTMSCIVKSNLQDIPDTDQAMRLSLPHTACRLMESAHGLSTHES